MKIRTFAIFFVIFALYYNRSYADNSNCPAVRLDNREASALLDCGWEYSPKGSAPLESVRSWSNLTVPLRSVPAGVQAGSVFWLRCRFFLLKRDDGLSLALNLGLIDSADETYFNGRLIGGRGNVAAGGLPSSDDRESVRVYTIPSEYLSRDGTNELAVRIRDGLGMPATAGLYSAVPRIGYVAGIRYLFYSRQAVELAFFGFIVLLLVYYFFFYLNLPGSPEYLYLSVFLAALAALVFFKSQWDTIAGIPVPVSMRVKDFLSIMIPSLFIPFVEELLAGSANRPKFVPLQKPSRIFVIFSFLLACVLLIAGGAVEGRALLQRYLTVVYVVGVVIAATVIYSGLRRGNRDAVYILWAFLPILGSMALDWLGRHGNIRYMEVSIHGVTFFLVLVSVITTFSFIRLQKEIISANVKLQQLDGLKNRFISNVSTEIGDPLRSIRDEASALITRPDRSTERTRAILRKMASEIHRALSLFERVFLTSKIDTGELRLSIRNSQLIPVIREASAAVEGLAARRGVVLEIVPFEPVSIPMDSKMLKTALFEILENAVYYTRPGGRVVLYVRSYGPVLDIAVADEGVGIPVQEIDMIFQKFYRLKSTEPMHPAGKGIGLYLAYQLVREMRGNIRVIRRERGSGSIFIVSIKLPQRHAGGSHA